MAEFPDRRLRRLRYHPTLRAMLAGVRLSVLDLVAPLFVRSGQGMRREIPSMPGQFQFSPDLALEAVLGWSKAGLRAVLLFGVPDRKDPSGSSAWDDDGPVQTLTRLLKSKAPEVLVLTDVCLCGYTDHGHCGVVSRRGERVEIDNDATLPLLAKAALSHARTGADLVAPSAMMDGQVAAIRHALDAAGLVETGILSYAVKFASSFYGPFREAAESKPAFGDRKSHQLDPANPRGIISEALADIDEGADILMVKPALPYLDVIASLRQQTDLPIAAYHVSGEYASIQAAARAGWLEERAAAIEVTTAIKRAGADLIITYFAGQLAGWLAEGA
jgi:porphobilinogen synthase